jgi:TetR/AcrR family transcriptional regulator, regulator of biofilm formation and stress response
VIGEAHACRARQPAGGCHHWRTPGHHLQRGAARLDRHGLVDPMTQIGDLPDGAMRMPPSRKGAKRKTAIVDAALRIIGEEGIQGISMRAVAVEASVPLGTVTYYFSDKEELIEAAFLSHSQRETSRIVNALANLGDGITSADLARGLAEFVIQGLTEYRAQLITEYQFMCESARRENLQRASAAWLQSLRAHLEATLTTLASSSPKTDAGLVLAVLGGLEIDNLGAAPGPVDEQAIRATLERLLHGLSELWLREHS